MSSVHITDGILAEDEPELDLPEGPRSLPVEVVNFTERVRAQAVTTHGVNCPYGQSVQLLNADPLREQAQITCLGDGQLWLCHSKAAADSIASFLDSLQGVSELNSYIPSGLGGTSLTYTFPAAMRLQAVSFTFAAGATVANRFPTIALKDNSGNTVFQVGCGGAVVASTNLQGFLSVGQFTQLAAANASYVALPNIGEIPAGWQLQFFAVSVQAGDAFTAAVITAQAGVNAGPAFDEVDGVPITQGTVMPDGATSGLWAVATGDNMFAGVLTERRQS